MAITIVLDAGHGGYDNGASYNGRKEKDDVLRATLAVGQQLEEAGYNVLYTRTTDRYDSPFEKAQIRVRIRQYGGDKTSVLSACKPRQRNGFPHTLRRDKAAEYELRRRNRRNARQYDNANAPCGRHLQAQIYSGFSAYQAHEILCRAL